MFIQLFVSAFVGSLFMSDLLNKNHAVTSSIGDWLAHREKKKLMKLLEDNTIKALNKVKVCTGVLGGGPG